MRAFVVASSPKAIRPYSLVPESGDLVVAADGGANLCLAWDWPVHQVVGDMDSVREDVLMLLRSQGVPMKRYPAEKDETDLEIALSTALAAEPEEIVIAGALGARIDHTLGNLALLALPDLAQVPTRIVDGGQTIRLVRGCLQVPGQPGDTLSLIPLGGDVHGVTVSGVHWPLEGDRLSLGPSLGISNRLTATLAEICVDQGTLLAIHIRADAVQDA